MYSGVKGVAAPGCRATTFASSAAVFQFASDRSSPLAASASTAACLSLTPVRGMPTLYVLASVRALSTNSAFV
jgi:hypothetical protein